MANNGTQLTAKQSRAIGALLSCRTVADAAERAKVGKRTLDRWLTDPVFKARLAAAEGELIDAATRRLLQAQSLAIGTLEDILQDPKVAASVRLRAAQVVIDAMLKLRELRSIEDRLRALEEAAHAKDQR